MSYLTIFYFILANPIRHQASRKVGCLPGDCRDCVGMHELTYTHCITPRVGSQLGNVVS